MPEAYADFHLHLLPGVDDGSATLQETLSMVDGLMHLGFDTFVCTPHQKEGSINPSLSSLREVHDVVVEEVQERYPSVRVILGAENFYDAQLSRRLDAHEVPGIAGSDVFLLEFPPAIDERTFRTALFRIQTEGYVPILAHVERYLRLDERILASLADELVMQVNLTSFVKEAQNADQYARAVRYVEKGLIRLFATDMHSVHMLPRVADAMAWIRGHFGDAILDQALGATPRQLLRDWVRLS